MGLNGTQSGQRRAASNSNQCKMKGLENHSHYSHCSHCSHYSHVEGEGKAEVLPVEGLRSLDDKARQGATRGNFRARRPAGEDSPVGVASEKTQAALPGASLPAPLRRCGAAVRRLLRAPLCNPACSSRAKRPPWLDFLRGRRQLALQLRALLLLLQTQCVLLLDGGSSRATCPRNHSSC
jgi:hypothetical protein